MRDIPAWLWCCGRWNLPAGRWPRRIKTYTVQGPIPEDGSSRSDPVPESARDLRDPDQAPGSSMQSGKRSGARQRMRVTQGQDFAIWPVHTHGQKKGSRSEGGKYELRLLALLP